MLTQIRYLKKGLFDTNIFICGHKEPSYDRLLKYYNYLKEMDLNSFLPIYLNEQQKYISITFKSDNLLMKDMVFVEQKMYDIVPEFQEIKKNNQTYINIKIVSIKDSIVENLTTVRIIDIPTF